MGVFLFIYLQKLREVRIFTGDIFFDMKYFSVYIVTSGFGGEQLTIY